MPGEVVLNFTWVPTHYCLGTPLEPNAATQNWMDMFPKWGPPKDSCYILDQLKFMGQSQR